MFPIFRNIKNYVRLFQRYANNANFVNLRSNEGRAAASIHTSIKCGTNRCPYHDPFNFLVTKTLRENDIDSVWNLLNGLTGLPQDYQYLPAKTIEAFAKYFDRNPENIPENLDKLLSFCRNLEMVFDKPTLKMLIDALNRHGHCAEISTIDST